MKRTIALCSVALLLLAVCATIGCARGERHAAHTPAAATHAASADSTEQKADANKYSRLTDEDFARVAEELSVESAAIKAVVSIEAGAAMKGFWAPGVPIVNFDRSMYNRYASRAASKAGDKNAKVPAGLSGYALKEWTELTNARKVNAQGANLGTFWGMFQIGGFCYKTCDCETIDEFVQKMSTSEFEQLELFAAFIKNSGYVKDLRVKNWAGFARKYNGPSYARRGYHTKMASAYSKFKAQEAKNKPAHNGDAKVSGKSLKVNN